MAELGNRAERAIEELSGNEALLGMLETGAAEELLNWGIEMVNQIADETEGMDEEAAEAKMSARLKAVRQFMRAVGNWAAGKYTDAASRVELRDKLLEYLQLIFGKNSNLPAPEKMDALLNEVDASNKSPLQLISNLRALVQESA